MDYDRSKFKHGWKKRSFEILAAIRGKQLTPHDQRLERWDTIELP